MCRQSLRAEEGFSLLETLVASAILVVALLSLAQLLMLATMAEASAGRATFASVLAAQKMETLRALTWDSVHREAGESADYLDRAGAPLDTSSGAYSRRWFIEPLPFDPGNALVIRVIVGSRDGAAQLVTIRAKRAP